VIHIKKINELKTGIILHDPILEMARINDPNQLPFDVFVYGGDSYGSGRNEHGDPHFHFADKIKGGNWQFSVLIPTVEQWAQSKELYISETSNGDYNWKGLRKEKKMLTDWLDKPNKDFELYSNIEVIRREWNLLNSDNKNVSQIKRIR
jgi:hypothetical protein